MFTVLQSKWKSILGGIVLFALLLWFHTYNPLLKRHPGFLVPNIVHFIHFDQTEFNFISCLCILAVQQNHQPETIYIHTNSKHFTGKYWNVLEKALNSTLKVNVIPKPTHVFGTALSSVYHSVDIARLQVLYEYGGIALDEDTFVVQSLNPFRVFEITVGWPHGQYIGTQIVIAQKGAPFLSYWLKSYQDYRPVSWYYNAGELPTKTILEKHPDLVHRIEDRFGVQNLAKELYSEYWPHWRDYYAIHLLWRHRDYLAKDDYKSSGIEWFNEINIQNYTKTFGEMARSVWNELEDV